MEKQSRLEKFAIESRSKQNNDFGKENTYDSTYEKVLEGSQLKKDATKFRENPHPAEKMEFEEPYQGQGYDLSQVKKGDPADGGHIHTIPSHSYSTTHFIAQLETSRGGDENDVAQREWLTGINKYNRLRAYDESSIDTTENLLDGQYFIP